MVEREWKVRLRSLIDEYVLVVVTLLVVLALVGGYLTYTTYATTDTRTETVETASWQSSGEFSHRAMVVNGTDVYERGETLRDRSSYFLAVTPRLNGTFAYTYAASDGGNLSATATTVLVLRSVSVQEPGPVPGTGTGTGVEGDNETEYWRLESTVGSREAESLGPGESLEVPFSVNVSAAAERLSEVDEQFGGTPGQKEMVVETRVQLSGTRNGRPVETTRVYRLPISTAGNVYEVDDPGIVTNSGAQTERRTVVVEPGPLRAYGGPAILALAVATGVLLGVGRYKGFLTVSERERDWLAYRNARKEFDDWITVARLPEEDRDTTTIEVDTLEGLANIAVYTDARVLKDPDRNLFTVFDGDRTYVYRPPALAETTTAIDADPLGDGSNEPAGDGDHTPGPDGQDESAAGPENEPVQDTE